MSGPRIPLPFHDAAPRALRDTQQRRNLGTVTSTIRAKRTAITGELPDWEALREAGAAIKDHTLRNLGTYLERLEARVAERGGVVHWARDGAEANTIVRSLVARTGEREVNKVKSMTTDEIGLNDALAEHGFESMDDLIGYLSAEDGGDGRFHREPRFDPLASLRTPRDLPDDETDES